MIERCFVVGFNHQHASIAERSLLALSQEQEAEMYAKAKSLGISSLCILNTCNRTELYGVGDIAVAEALYKSYSPASEQFSQKMMRKTGEEAMRHFYQVSSGLDSQIIGDLQIPGQFKTAVKTATHFGMVDTYFQRLTNSCFQASKEIRTRTMLSDGTTSVSYAVIKILKDIQPSVDHILLIGTGKFGINIAQNIKTYFPSVRLSVSNRTASKATAIANKLRCQQVSFEHIAHELHTFDVVIVAVDKVNGYLLTADMFADREKEQILFDLSVPITIDPQIAEQSRRRIFTTDDASEMINRTIQERMSYLPLAQEIIHQHMQDFLQWTNMYNKSGYIKSWKNVVLDFSKQCPFIQTIGEEDREKMLTKCMADFTGFIRDKQKLPEDHQHVIEDFFEYHRNILQSTYADKDVSVE